MKMDNTLHESLHNLSNDLPRGNACTSFRVGILEKSEKNSCFATMYGFRLCDDITVRHRQTFYDERVLKCWCLDFSLFYFVTH